VHFYSRRFWGARPPARAMSAQSPPHEAFVHHSDNAQANHVNSGPEMKAAMRGIQNFHLDVRGWSDIAYHYVVFQHQDGQERGAHVFKGRDPHFVPAAQLNHNTGTLAICVYGNLMTDGVHPGTIEAIAAILGEHAELITVGGHRDVTSTSCPGDHLYRALDSIAHAAGLQRYPHHG
jgi:hypothetical protein